MARFSGPQSPGALRRYRETKRAQAEARQLSERERDAERLRVSQTELWAWRRSPEGRRARRFQRDLERRLQGVLTMGRVAS